MLTLTRKVLKSNKIIKAGCIFILLKDLVCKWDVSSMVCFFPRRRREVSGRYTIGNQMYFYKEYLAQKEKSMMENIGGYLGL